MASLNVRLNVTTTPVRYLADDGTERLGVRSTARALGGTVHDAVYDQTGVKVPDPIAIRDGWGRGA